MQVLYRIACRSGSEFKSMRNEKFNKMRTMIPEDGTYCRDRPIAGR